MPQPCRSCDRREIDFGGCRCQAFQLTGDAARTDPVCHLSPDHEIVAEVVRAANQKADQGEAELVPRVITGRGTSNNHSPTGSLGSEGSVP
jgi:PqqA peptide cyclase